MRVLKLVMGDIRFQWKYGFYIVYAIFTVVYLLVLASVPEDVRRTVAAAMIFTDPAAMGLFFMGAIVLLEKSQHVNCAMAVSPVRVWEYCMAKLFSLALIGVVVAMILAVFGTIPKLASSLLGVLLSSFLCSACGLIAAMKSRTLNQFILLAAPFEMFLCLPPIVLLFHIDHPLLAIHPGIAAVWLIYGDAPSTALCLVSLIVWSIPVLWLCVGTVKRNFLEMGGASI